METREQECFFLASLSSVSGMGAARVVHSGAPAYPDMKLIRHPRVALPSPRVL